jgi:hypothetical protein
MSPENSRAKRRRLKRKRAAQRRKARSNVEETRTTTSELSAQKLAPDKNEGPTSTSNQIVTLSLSSWRNFSWMFDSSGHNNGRRRDIVGGICREIIASKDTFPAIEKLEREKCTLGLVLIAGLRKGDEREAAIRAIARVSRKTDITSSDWAGYDAFSQQQGHFDPEGIKTFILDGKTYKYQKLFRTPKTIARIALEERSVGLAAYIFSASLRAKNKQDAKKLGSLLIDNRAWLALGDPVDTLPDSMVIRCTDHIEDIAKKRMGRRLLPQIAAIHPEREVRLKAIHAIRDGGVDREGNIPYYLIDSAGQSRFPDTGIIAIDIATQIKVKMLEPGESINDACLGYLFNHETNPKIIIYGLQKMLELWDEYTGYEYIHQWDNVPRAVKKAICKYFAENFDKLVSNQEWTALHWLSQNGKRKDRKRALAILSERVRDIPSDMILRTIKQSSKDKEARDYAEQVIEARRERSGIL